VDVLGVARLSMDDNFFELGGDSAGVLHMLAALHGRVGTRLAPADFLSEPTVNAVVGRLNAAWASYASTVDESTPGAAGLDGPATAEDITVRRLLEQVESLSDSELQALLDSDGTG
jgi:acyl carrier protein